MKILFVITGLGMGGAESKHVYWQIEWLMLDMML